MTAAERRLVWALIIGGLVFGLTAGKTDAWLLNVLIGAAYGVPATIAIWCLLEGVAWVTEARRDAPSAPPRQPSNVRVMDRDRYTRNDEKRPE